MSLARVSPGHRADFPHAPVEAVPRGLASPAIPADDALDARDDRFLTQLEIDFYEKRVPGEGRRRNRWDAKNPENRRTKPLEVTQKIPSQAL